MNARLSAYPITEKFIRWLLDYNDAGFNYRGRHLAYYAPASELAEVELSLAQIRAANAAADDARHAAEAK